MKTIIVIALLAVGGCASVGERVLDAGTTGSMRFEAAVWKEQSAHRYGPLRSS